MLEIVLVQFMILYFFNLLLDYPLQGEFLASGKADNLYLLWVHCAIWGFGLSLVLIPLGLFTWAKMLMLVVGHFLIDYVKAHGLWCRCYDFSAQQELLLDQLLHVVQIVLCLI